MNGLAMIALSATPLGLLALLLGMSRLEHAVLDHPEVPHPGTADAAQPTPEAPAPVASEAA